MNSSPVETQTPLLSLRRLQHSFPGSRLCLKMEHLDLHRGEKVALIGRSGCGKSTLLDLIAGIQVPQRGDVFWGTESVNSLSETRRRDLRLKRIGFIFQDICLIAYLNVLDNILVPWRLSPSLKLTTGARDLAVELANRVGLGDQLQAPVNTLSQGEKQRLMICRALVTKPSLVLADEATSSLDPLSRDLIQTTLMAYVQQQRAGLLAVTHDHQTLHTFDRVIDLEAD
jgi:putative ABC transport system ATP-binding protein